MPWAKAALLALPLLAQVGCSGSSNPLGGASSPDPDAGVTVDSGSQVPTEAGVPGQTCGATQACGSDGTTYQECSVLGTTGQCAAVLYETSDGHSFTCAGCTHCSAAQQQLSAYCDAHATRDAGPGTDASLGDASVQDSGDHDASDRDGGRGGTTCSQAVTCGALGATFEQCTTTDAAGHCVSTQYQVSGGGPVYTCATCGDCTAAVAGLNAYCASQATPTTSCTPWTACESSALSDEECTTSVAGACQSRSYQTTDGHTFACASCNDCSAALANMDTYCNQQTTPLTTCGAASACGTGGATYQQCTTNQGSICDGAYYTTSTGQKYTCTSCSDCTFALLDLQGYCSGLVSTGNVVLMGGFDSTGNSLADSWVWNGATWTAGSAGPGARADALGATLNGEFVLFGGTTSTSVTSNQGDTWGWNGSTWSSLATTGPSARFGSAVATLGGEIVLFGGCTTNTAANDLADTWLWNGASWSSLAVSGPPARVGASAASLNGQVVVFGGMDVNSTYLGDTWVFNGTQWVQMTPPTSPPARFYGSMATVNGQVVLFGGSNGGDLGDTWVWNGATWSSLTVTGPSARAGAAATTWNGTMVLFGGEVGGTYQSDTWIWNGSSWASQSATGPTARFGASMGAVP